MAETMTPSQMTTKQVKKAVGNYRAMLEKHAGDFPVDVVQRVLGQSELAGEQFAVFRRRVEAEGKTVRRPVTVDRKPTAVQVIDVTGRVKWYIDQEVMAEMPLAGRVEETVEVFELDYDPTVNELDREYETRGLRSDPPALAQLMIDDPAFADERPVATQWRDKQGRACYALFSRFDVRREVFVRRFDGRWNRGFRFAGVRK